MKPETKISNILKVMLHLQTQSKLYDKGIGKKKPHNNKKQLLNTKMYEKF